MSRVNSRAKDAHALSRKLQLVASHMKAIDKRTKQLIRLFSIKNHCDRIFERILFKHAEQTDLGETSSPHNLHCLEQILFNYQAEEACLRHSLRAYKPSYTESAFSFGRMPFHFGHEFQKETSRIQQDLEILRFQLRSKFQLRSVQKNSTKDLQLLWEEKYLPLENFLQELNHRITHILKIEESQKKEPKERLEERKASEASKLARVVGFSVQHFKQTQLKVDRTLEHRKLNGASLSTTSIAHRYSTPFGECIDPSIKLNAAAASTTNTNVFASRIPFGSLLLSNLGPLPFEESLMLKPRGKNNVRLPRLESHLARLKVPLRI